MVYGMCRQPVYYQLGKFVVRFQHIERVLTELFDRMANAHDESLETNLRSEAITILSKLSRKGTATDDIEILTSNLIYTYRVTATDKLFAHLVDLLRQPDSESKSEEKKKFSSLMEECKKLGYLRNELVHSWYAHLMEGGSGVALVPENPKLRGGQGRREIQEEDLSTASFEPYFERITAALDQLESFRGKVIDWIS